MFSLLLPSSRRGVVGSAILSSSVSRRLVPNILIVRWKSSAASLQPKQQQHTSKAREEPRRRLDIAIVGAPNAGKSQLLNVLLQQKVAAVSRKRHTTRGGILGVRTIMEYNTQLVFVDTPGFVKSNQRTGSSTSTKKQDPDIIYELSSAAIAEMEAVDYTLLVVDAARGLGSLEPDEPNIYRDALIALMIRATLAKGRKRLIMPDESSATTPEAPEGLRETFGIVFNKVDLVTPKVKLLDLAEQVGAFADEVMIEYAERLKRQDPTYDSTTNMLQLSENHDADTKSSTKSTSTSTPSSSSPPEWEKVYPEFFYTSALHDDGVDDILQHLLEIATPCDPIDDDDDDDEEKDDWLIPPSSHDAPEGPSTSSFLSPAEQVEEIIREKLYRCLHREVPHHVNQINRTFRYANIPKGASAPTRANANAATRSTFSKSGGSDSNTTTSTTVAANSATAAPVHKVLFIEQDLVVFTKSHHRLVLGRNGNTLQRIHDSAISDLEDQFGCKVVLKLHVKHSTSPQERAKEAELEGLDIVYYENPDFVGPE